MEFIGESYVRYHWWSLYLVFTRMPGDSYRRVPQVEFMYLLFTRMPGESYRRIPLVEFVYLVFTRMPGESYCRLIRCLLLHWCYVFHRSVNQLTCLLIL